MTETEKAPAKRDYRVLSPIKSGGKRHTDGVLSLTDEDAEPAVAAGALEAVDKNKDGKADKTKAAK